MTDADAQPIGTPDIVVVAGASGGLAAAISEEIRSRHPAAALVGISRAAVDNPVFTATLQTDLGAEASIAEVGSFLAAHLTQAGEARPQALGLWVINCCGILHDQQHGPEKAIGQCSDEWLLESMRVNVLPHMHLARALAPLLKKKTKLAWASLSAKVGSIEDNGLGGWYSYRMSKAALNMLVKNLSIEWQRKLAACAVFAIHPGTTDTALSKPFQQNIAEDKLYSPQLSAARIVDVLDTMDTARNGKLLFWDGSILPW